MFRPGYTPTPEQRAKQREAAKRRWAEGRGQVQTPALREVRSANGKRQWAEGRGSIAQMHTPEAEARCADSNRRSPRKRAQLARLARAKIGVPVSEETRARQSRAQIYLSKLRRIRNRPKFSSSLFDERRIAELIVRWQRDGDGETFAEIIRASLPLINHLIYKYSAQSRDDFAEVRAEVILKLSKALLKFDPARGKAFTLYYFAIKRFLFSRFEKIAVRRSREVVTDPEVMAGGGS